MSIFNQHSRTRNVMHSSVVGATCNLVNTLMGFAYRSIFIHILSGAYLGVNGLFGSILQILSISELGISTAITYRFYDPISRQDINKVGQLINFYKKVYQLIAGVILLLGISIFPFLDFFIKDASEVPPDVNLRLIYILFLLQSVSTYLYAYKQTLLSADQKQHFVSLFNTVVSFLRYVLQILSLWIWRNFTLTLIISIAITVLCNYLLSLWVTAKYKPVFEVCASLPKNEQKQIFLDTRATIMHKIGGTILGATDSIVLSKYVGLAITGVCSNYAMLISNVSGIIDQLLTSFTGSVGSAHVELSKEAAYAVYKRLLFLNLWIGGMVTTCMFLLINDFICLWVGKQMLLDQTTVIVLCVQFYFQLCRKVSMAYTNACGLFVKDKIRPLIEAAINLITSVVAVIYFGIVGVFLGTVLSYLATVFWREPYILYKFEFKKPLMEYWKMYSKFALLAVGINTVVYYIQNNILRDELSIILWLIQAVGCVLAYNICAGIAFHREEEFFFYYQLVVKFLTKLKGKICR